MEGSYEFDPCTIDGSDKEEEVTLDSWKPSAKVTSLPKSEWRQKQNDGNFNQQPGIDELKKINMCLKRKYPDHQIMDAFGISCETLVAIKRGCYGPIDGISLDNQSKISKEFARIDKKLERFLDGFKFLADNVFESSESAKRMGLKACIGLKPKKEKELMDEEE